MRIEPATVQDCRAVAEVQVESWQRIYQGILPEPFLASLSVAEREAGWRRMVGDQSGHLLLARTDDQPVGFVAFGASRDEGAAADCAEVWALYVRPAFWSTGAGRQLWLAALQQLRAEQYRRICLWVIAGNARAIRFYERAGFIAEPASRKRFELGGATLEEVRHIYEEASMSPKQLVNEWVRRFNNADVDGLVALYAPDATNHQVVMEPLIGREAIRQLFAVEFARAEMVCLVEHLFEDGEWAILEWRDPSGLRGCGFFQVQAGRIVFQRGYFDQLSFFRLQGLPVPDTYLGS